MCWGCSAGVRRGWGGGGPPGGRPAGVACVQRSWRQWVRLCFQLQASHLPPIKCTPSTRSLKPTPTPIYTTTPMHTHTPHHTHTHTSMPPPHLCSGANLDVDVPWKWLNFFLEDDARLAQVGWQMVVVVAAAFWR